MYIQGKWKWARYAPNIVAVYRLTVTRPTTHYIYYQKAYLLHFLEIVKTLSRNDSSISSSSLPVCVCRIRLSPRLPIYLSARPRPHTLVSIPLL